MASRKKMVQRTPDLSNEFDAIKLRNWMANSKKLGRTDVFQAALRQLCRAEGVDIDDPLERDFATTIRALEEALTDESGKKRRLSRTRQKLARDGVHRTVSDLATQEPPGDGFAKLVEFEMADLSAEALVVRYQDQFDATVVDAAVRRLAASGVVLPDAG